MSVGGQISTATVNQALTDLSVGMRNLMTQVQDTYQYVTASGGITFLEGLGYTAADAQSVMTYLGYMNSVAAVYFGSGTQATASNFNAALAVLWAGQ